MAKKKKKINCTYCGDKGLFPWCPICFHYSTITKEQYDKLLKDAKEERLANTLTKEESIKQKNLDDIDRFRYLENTKVLKLKGYCRSKDILTGNPAVDAIINQIFNEVISQIHCEIDAEDITQVIQVLTRFDELLYKDGKVPVEVERNKIETHKQYWEGRNNDRR
jgi:hypothetical protein